MKHTAMGWLRSSSRVAVCAATIWLAGTAARAQAVATTTVQGTVYLANGQPAEGTLVVSWPTFTTAAGQLISAGSTTVTVGADGFVSVNLTPNQGAMPAGEYYTAIFYKANGTVSTQYWVVPAATQASLAQVQAQVMPAAQAVQAVSKAYVDQTVSQALGSGLSASGGNLSGPLFLSSDPTQPLQAADKHYVDSSFSAALPLSGGTITGPASFSAAVTFGSTVTASSVSAASANGVWDLKAKFGAVGSNETMSCTAASSYTLTGCSGGDFTAGEYVFLPFAGEAPTISAPDAPTVSCGSDNGGSCTGSTVYAYKIVAIQSGYVNGPMTAPSSSASVTQATQTAQTPTNNTAADVYTNVSWTAVTGATGYAIYKSINGGSYNFYEVVQSGTTSIKDFNHAQSAQFTCTDVGYSCTAPSAATPSGVFAQIASVSGSTVTLEARGTQPADPSEPGISGVVTVEHDDSPAFYALYQAAASAAGQIQVHIPAGNYVVHPYNQPPGSSTSLHAVLMLDGLKNLHLEGDGEGVTNIYVEAASPTVWDLTGEFIDGVQGWGNSCSASFGGSGAGYAISDPAKVSAVQVTLASASDASHFTAGQEVTVYDNASGYPWEYYGETNKVLDIDSATGLLTLAYPLTKTYSSTLPAPYSSCSSCQAAPMVAPGTFCTENFSIGNMTVRGPVMFANVSNDDGFAVNRMNVQTMNFILEGSMRHFSVENSRIMEDPWGDSESVSSEGLLQAAAATTDADAKNDNYKNPHLGPVGWQACSEGSANITDQDNTYQLYGSADQDSAPNTALFDAPVCFNYTMQGDTISLSNTNMLGVFGGDLGDGASGAIKDNTVSVDSASRTEQASVGSAIAFGNAFTSPYLTLNNNKWIGAADAAALGPMTANDAIYTPTHGSIAFSDVTGAFSGLGAVYGAADTFVLNLGSSYVSSINLGSTRIANYFFKLVLVQPSSGSVSWLYPGPTCASSFWGVTLDCTNVQPPGVSPAQANGAVTILSFWDDGTTVHFLGSNAATSVYANTSTANASGGLSGAALGSASSFVYNLTGNVTSVNLYGYNVKGSIVAISFVQPASGGPYTLPASASSWSLGTTPSFINGAPQANPAASSTTTILFLDDGSMLHEIARNYWAPGTGPGGTIVGTATLVAGTVTVSTGSACAIGSTCTYQLTRCATGGTAGYLSVGTITAGTSFVINSSSATDTSEVCWSIVP